MPGEEPKEAEEADARESATPTKHRRTPHRHRWRNYRADGRAGIGKTDGERSLFGRGPLDGTFRHPGNTGTFANTEQEARGAQTPRSRNQGMEGAGQRPEAHGQAQAEPRAQGIKHPATEAKHHGVTEDKGKDDPRIDGVRHGELLRDARGQHAQDLAIKEA